LLASRIYALISGNKHGFLAICEVLGPNGGFDLKIWKRLRLQKEIDKTSKETTTQIQGKTFNRTVCGETPARSGRKKNVLSG